MKHPKIIYGILFLTVLSSCEKEIEVDIPFPEEKIVVDGKIEVGLPPYVILTRNMPFFGTNSITDIQNSFIHNATITVSNGSKTVLLNEYYSKSYPDSLQALFASISGIDSNIVKNFNFSVYTTTDVSMFGKVGGTYALTITSGNNKLNSVTSISPPVPIDSLWAKYVKRLPNGDSLGHIYGHFKEPGNTINAYRWMAKRVRKDISYVSPRGAVFNDKYLNGQSFDFFYNRGSLPNSQAPDDYNEYSGYYKKGDTVAIKLCSIDQGVYKFYRSLEIVQDNNGNPFASPAQVETNIAPADRALGVWCGYGIHYDTLIFK